MRPMQLSEYLSQHNLTQKAFAALIDRDISTVSRLARGETRPDWSTVAAIEKATNGAVTANDFTPAPSSEAA